MTTHGLSKLPLTPLVGRERELRALHDCLQRPSVTAVVGPPGVGKSHLVRHYVETCWAHEASSPVFWVDLTHGSDADALCALVATALELADDREGPLAPEPRSSPVHRVARALSGRGKALLVLEHFDGVARAGVGFIEHVARTAVEARILITARVRLDADWALHRVQPLALPTSHSPADVRESAAVRMLLARASRYRFRDEDAEVLCALVRQLDGLPLAIELAARRLSVLSPRALLERLGARFDLLQARDKADGRVVSLRDMLESACRDLSPVEKRLLALCSTFRGGFDIAALEAIRDVEIGDEALCDALTRLVDRSLVQELETPSGERRFLLLESVRMLAAEHLAEVDTACLRHARYYAEGAIEEADVDNVSAAYTFVCALPAALGLALRVRLLVTLLPWGGTRVSAELWQARLDDTLALAIGTAEVEVEHVALLLGARAAARRQSGRVDEAREDLLRGLSLLGAKAGEAREAGELRVRLLCQLGALHQAQGRLDQALSYLERARAGLPGLRRPELEGRVYFALGILAHSQGRLDLARAHYEHAADRFRVVAAKDAEAETLAYLAGLLLQRGLRGEARAHYHDALACRERVGDDRLSAMILGNLAILEQEEGDTVRAFEYLTRALAAAHKAAERLFEGHLLGYRGCLGHERGQFVEAQADYQHAVAIVREVGDRRLEGVFLGCLGGLYAARGLIDAAREAFDQATGLLALLGDEGSEGAVSVHRGHLLLARARSETEPMAMRAACLEAAEELLDAAHRDPLFQASDDLRFAARVLARSLDENALTITLDKDGVVQITPPLGTACDLSTRGPLRRLVSALFAQRNARPGLPLSTEQLIEAGWPFELMAYEAGLNRLKVALAAFRKAGLRDVMLRVDGGYLLDPAVRVRTAGVGAMTTRSPGNHT